MERRRIVNIIVVGLALGIGSWGCGAPRSRPAAGPVADEVVAAIAGGSGRFDHHEWDHLLRQGTSDGRVRYGVFVQQRSLLDTYLDRVAAANLAELSANELKALLINAYNAHTVRSILDHPQVSSIREIDGVWTSATHRVGGHELTLDAIEHTLLRPFFRDPRIHFAVNCASASCAPLPPWAYRGELLDEQLEERTRAFLSSPEHVRVENGTLYLSSYFDWYGGDFVAEGWSPRADSIPSFVARYASSEVQAVIAAADGAPPVRYLDYDWTLNEVREPATAPIASPPPR